MTIRETVYDGLSMLFLAALVLLPGWLGLLASLTAMQAWPTLGVYLSAVLGVAVALMTAAVELAVWLWAEVR